MKVYSISGSVVTENLDRLDELAEALEGDEPFVVVTGAGPLSRYIDASSANEGRKDLIGIKATRLHASTLASEIEGCNTEIPETPEELVEMSEVHRNIVTGGFVPGYSTDAVAATIAELLEAELVIATRVDGVYTADPEKEDAERLEQVTAERLRDLVSGNSSAGGYELIDGTAINIIERSNISTRVVKGSLESLENPDQAVGTRIVSE